MEEIAEGAFRTGSEWAEYGAVLLRARGVRSAVLRIKERRRQAGAAEIVELQLAAAAQEEMAWRSAAIEAQPKNYRSLVVGPGFDPDHLRASLAAEAIDMRCGIDRRAERVKLVIGEDPQTCAGDLA